MSILTEKLGPIREHVLDLLLPQACLLCASPSGRELLCPVCLTDLPALPAPACPRCALPTCGGEVCGRCQRHPPHFNRLVAAFPYTFPIDRLLQHYKYAHQLALAPWFGECLYLAAAGLDADLIVPMPLHPRRLAERGFNQALEIARPLARRFRIPLATDLCQRQRATPPQEGLSLRQRLRNMRDAFACNDDLSGKRVLLVDDVVTTGASAGECARTLRLHGAAAVTVIAVARTLRD